jgi:hypothetical protein
MAVKTSYSKMVIHDLDDYFHGNVVKTIINHPPVISSFVGKLHLFQSWVVYGIVIPCFTHIVDV